MGFPILRLPFLALKVVVNHLKCVELVTVSLLSKPADRILKACGKKHVSFFNLEGSDMRDLCDFDKFVLLLLGSRRKGIPPESNLKMCCYMMDENYFSIICKIPFSSLSALIYIDTVENIEQFVGVRRNLMIGDSLVPVVITKENDGVEKITTFWSSETDGMMEFMDYFIKTFNLPLEELKFASKDTEAIKTIVNHIKSTEIVVRKVQVRSYPRIPDDDFKLILMNVSATERFSSRLKTSKKFEFDGKIHAKNIEIQNGHWFTIRNLLMCTESELIHVSGSDYTKEEYRTVLSDWKAGKLPKLKKLKLATKVSWSDIIEGFERREERCTKCWSRPGVIIKGHKDSYACLDASDCDGFHFLIHDN